jgi:putative PEP-CTERM system integral membrane protein
MKQQLPTSLRKFINLRIWVYGLFWSWNLIFLAFMLLGFAPRLLPEMLAAVRSGDIPAAFPVYALLLTLIPVGAVTLGLTLLRRSPDRLFALGYGIEGPLMLLLLIRFFAVRELTPALALLMGVAALGLLTFLWQILDQGIDRRGWLLTHLRLIGLTLLLITGLYAGSWLAFYAVPLAALGLNWLAETLINLPWFLGDLLWGIWEILTGELLYIPFILLGFTLMVYSATLFVLMPLALPILCLRAWWNGLRLAISRYGLAWSGGLTIAVLILCAVLFVRSNIQPQHEAFALLETPPANLAEAEALMAQEETIRAGLLNAYLAPFRYFSAVGEVYHVSEMYQHALGLTPTGAGQVQALYEAVARPVLYAPVKTYEIENRWENMALREEPLAAAELYESFFDQPIIEGERETVVQAVRSTWSVDQAQAAWQAVDDREIYLARQSLTITEQGEWAALELYEVYQNQTFQRQEVVYYFSLPESAVITGVWLGNSPDRAERFAYQVAPRGAAQAVYRNEVRRNVDPALVEQIGPRQYRLRIFPIEPQGWTRGQDGRRAGAIETGPALHMWLTFRVLAQDNAWPLPHLAEKRNVYWNDESIRLVNGQPMAADEESWLPRAVPALAPVQPAAHRVDFPNGQTVLVRPATAADLPEIAGDLRLAVVLDRSRSMQPHAAEVEAALERLGGLGAAVDLYLTASAYRGEAPSRVDLADIDPGAILYVGGQNAAELLAQFETLAGSRTYQAIFVLTDGSGYALGEGDVAVPRPAAPVWMVHLDGDFPLGYDDPTLEAIQASGGGAAASLEEALNRWALSLEHSGDEAAPDLIDGYVWRTLPTELAAAEAGQEVKTDPGFTALAARRLILAAMQRQRAGLDQLETLDQLHAIALDNSIVTPYSSMIVLVNWDQKRLLEQLERAGDRFEREFEDVGETAPIDVTGVPEPEEWLLLALAVAMLGWYLRARYWRVAT